MSHEFCTSGTVQSGKLALADPSGMRRALAQMDGHRVEVIVRTPRETRSARQLRWLWGVAYEMFVEHYGYDLDERREAKEQLHYALLKRCFGSRWDERIGAEVPNVPASRHLDTKRCGEYMEWLVRYAAREGLVIELPDELKGAA